MFLHQQGELALSSRFKAISESLYSIANAAYRANGVAFDAHWFPVLRYLQVKGPASVTEIASAIGQTHPGVSQLAAKLRAAGWITRRTDRKDARRGVLELSPDAERTLDRLGPLWCAIRRGAGSAAARGKGSLLDTLAAFERDIASGRIADDIASQHARLRNSPVEIRPYEARWAPHFERINAEWLRRHFSVEAVDEAMFADPQTRVLDPGGAILFALIDGEVIGTCALLKEAPGVYELSKMGVESGYRNSGVGRKLLAAAIAEFGRRRGKTLFLESNSKLKPALMMYESAGFVHQPAPKPGSHYARSDVYMIYAKKGVAKAKAARAKHPRTRQ